MPIDADPATVRRYKANLDDEIDGIAVYRMLAEAERDEERRSIFEELAAVEERHADLWRRNCVKPASIRGSTAPACGCV